MKAAPAPRTDHVDAVRRFNRFYTRQVGVLGRRFLDSPFSITEVRVLYELSARGTTTAAALQRELALDAGYLSRLLAGLRRRKILARAASATDRRESILSLTARGREVFAPLEARQVALVKDTLGGLDEPRRTSLVGAMRTIEAALRGAPAAGSTSFVLRPPRPGDMGWITHRQGVLYNEEYGWDERFEALIARIVSDFVMDQDPARERCFIAERDGEVVGSVFCVTKSRTVAKLRLLYVEPGARGLGIGRRLVEECLAFARRTGYKKITLWTNSQLHAARRIYEEVGFRMVAEEAYQGYGHDLVAQTWELIL